ncbi:MAG: NADH-quinone oxidoreductase subunit L [bacterium]|jgi:ech hydrogenase subunit A|nr:proton-conducting transporter membrane subunit [bacterium]
MHLYTFLSLLLIFGPLIFGLLVMLAPGWRYKTPVIVLSALTIMAGGILLALQGPFTLSIDSGLMKALPLIELLILAIIIYIGFAIKKMLIIGLGILQLAIGLISDMLPHSVQAHVPTLKVDLLAVIMVLIVSVIGPLIVMYAIGYMKRYEVHGPEQMRSTGLFFFFLIGFLGVMNGLVMSNDLKLLAIFWELTTLCSFMLIGHDKTEDAGESAYRALWINSLGGAALMLASFLSISASGSASLDELVAVGSLLPLALICLAAFTKSAQLPFQSWLLGAMVAPTPVSALLHSTTMVKAGVYLIIRLAPGLGGTRMGQVVAIAGAFTFALASAMAISQSNGKKVLAYSTIANLGLIIICAAIHTPLAYAAAILLTCFHAISKAMLFLCVGTIEQGIGSRDIEDMEGLMRKMPITTVIAIIGMVSMMMPPFGMLIGKWMALEAVIMSPLVLFLLIMGSALTVVFWSKWIGRIQTVAYHPVYKIEDVPFSMFATKGVLLLGIIAAAAVVVPLFKRVISPMAMAMFSETVVTSRSWDLMNSASAFIEWPLFFMLALVAPVLFLVVRGIKKSHIRQPFLCGENLEGAKTTFEFRTLMDKGESARIRSYYLNPLFGEAHLTAWANPIAIALIFIMFGVISK